MTGTKLVMSPSRGATSPKRKTMEDCWVRMLEWKVMKALLLNRAALTTPGDINADGSLARPWRLCTVDQVEDLKAVVRILPLWLSSIFLSVSIGIVLSLAILQALSLDRRLGPHFTVPAGTLSVVALVAAAVTLPALDRCLYPAWRRLVGRPLTPLQRVGVGHVVNTAAMAAAALVERRRLASARSLHELEHQPGALVPMSVLWLVPPLAMVGLGESFHFPGQVALYYQVFPETLRSSATGLVGLSIAVGFYVSTAVVDLVRRVTDWLAADINAGRLDKVCWMLAAVGVINFGFYLLCACSYRYQAVVDQPERSSKELE
ncbi:hypothetical protein Taro_031600 [Colocasia esculenta]|uniref:Uncharacterized protein n=1 Tax=Colocasia esculenta TaxID=4460 RepID=A0A843W1E0_COLES|nr:hypothetical protein [Colocasia esculenta]